MVVNEKIQWGVQSRLIFGHVSQFIKFIGFCCLMVLPYLVSGQDILPDSTVVISPIADDIVLNEVAKHPWLTRTRAVEAFPAMVHPDHNRTGSFLTALLLLGVMAILRQLFPRYVDSLTSFIRPGNRTARQDNLPLQTDEKAAVLFNVLYYFGLGSVLFFWLDAYTPWRHGEAPWLFWLKVCGLLSLYFMVKHGFRQWVANTFSQQEILKRYRFMVRVNNQTIAVFLIPCLVLLIMTRQQVVHPWLIGISLGVIGLGWLIRTLKSREWVLRLLQIDGLHFFLYLCAFEFVPAWVLFKLVAGMN